MASTAATHKSKAGLLDTVLEGLRQSGWQFIVTGATHPFGIRIFREGEAVIPLRVYIWNCTHGGGSMRADDEYRIQFTGKYPKEHVGEKTILLGWHDGYGVFAGWSVKHHEDQAGASPSAQIKEATLAGAHAKAIATQVKANKQVVVAFRPEFLVDYIKSVDELHEHGYDATALAPLDDLASLDNAAVDAIPDSERRLVIRRFVKHYRAHDFRKRIVSAYDHACAFCGLQLELLDAAHILPVADVTSTDQTSNGIALCKLHHAAFDQNLISFNEAYKIEVSAHEVARLSGKRRDGGIDAFVETLKPAIQLPADARDYPPIPLIKKAREVRRWIP